MEVPFLVVFQPVFVTSLSPFLRGKNCFREFRSDPVLHGLQAATKKERVQGCGSRYRSKKRRVGANHRSHQPDPNKKEKCSDQVEAHQKNGTLRTERNLNRPFEKLRQPSPDTKEGSGRRDADHGPK